MISVVSPPTPVVQRSSRRIPREGRSNPPEPHSRPSGSNLSAPRWRHEQLSSGRYVVTRSRSKNRRGSLRIARRLATTHRRDQAHADEKRGQGTGLGERVHGAKSGSHSTLRWREMDSNFRFLVARPSNRHGRSDRFLETWSGSVGEPEGRIHLPPARSQLPTRLRGLGRRKFHGVTNAQQPSRPRGDSQRQTADTFNLQPYLISRSFC